MTTHKFLYRGVNIEIHNRKEGLNPKGLIFRRQAQLGEEYANLGSGLQLGYSEVNAILAHQTDSAKFPSSGVSTTPHYEIAKKYATFNNKNGVVYKIDPTKFDENGIEIFIVNEWIPFPKLPEDDEIILKHKSDTKLSMDIIVEVIEVDLPSIENGQKNVC